MGRAISSQNCPFARGIWIHLVGLHGSLGSPESATKTASRSV